MFVFYNDGANAVTVEGLSLAQNEAMAFLHDDGEQEWYPLFDFYTKAEIDALLAALDHGNLNGLADDDHAQYLTTGRADTWFTGKSVGSLGTKDHHLLTGLSDDDHSQYLLLAGRTGQIAAGPLKVGAGANYSEFEADGTLVFNGDATVWEDLNFDPDRSGGPVATRPDDVTINNVFHKEFTSANNQLCGASQEIFHETMLSKTLYPHCHVFLKASETSGTTGVSFTLYWELRQHSGTTSGSVVVSATSAQLAANAHKVDLYDNTGFTGPTELGAQLAMTIKRTAGDAGDVIVTSYGIHYEIDTVGSRALTSK
jgi:hypothetical protein